MEIRLLRYFLAVAQEESISKAAARLHLTQPTLSRQLINLEEDLGKKLFSRGNRQITLTEDGMLLRKRAEEIVALVDMTEAELAQPDGDIGGDVYIGGGETPAMRLVADAMRRAQADHPRIRFHLHSGNAEDVIERLDKGLLDYGLLIMPTNISRFDSWKLPATDVWGVLMRKDSPLAMLDCVRPEDIQNQPLICSHQRLVSQEMASWMNTDYASLNHVATYNLVYNASLLVEQGLGYALCLDKLVSGEGDLCFRPLEPRLEAEIFIVSKKGQLFSKAAGIFQQYLFSSRLSQ